MFRFGCVVTMCAVPASIIPVCKRTLQTLRQIFFATGCSDFSHFSLSFSSRTKSQLCHLRHLPCHRGKRGPINCSRSTAGRHIVSEVLAGHRQDLTQLKHSRELNPTSVPLFPLCLREVANRELESAMACHVDRKYGGQIDQAVATAYNTERDKLSQSAHMYADCDVKPELTV